jgi:hypothetical protein
MADQLFLGSTQEPTGEGYMENNTEVRIWRQASVPFRGLGSPLFHDFLKMGHSGRMMGGWRKNGVC